jgi:hypothetical protein
MEPSAAPGSPPLRSPAPVASSTVSMPNEAEEEAASSQASGAGRRHRGFFLRSFLGAGYRTASESSEYGDARISGGGAGVGIEMGGALAENLILHGDLFYEVASNPTLKTDEGSVDLDGGKLTFVALGPGVSYYVMPANIHFGASLLLCKMSFGTDDETFGSSDWGYGGALRFGKDFWLGKEFSLGALGQVAFAHMKDGENAEGESRNLNSTTATVAFSMSYH